MTKRDGWRGRRNTRSIPRTLHTHYHTRMTHCIIQLHGNKRPPRWLDSHPNLLASRSGSDSKRAVKPITMYHQGSATFGLVDWQVGCLASHRLLMHHQHSTFGGSWSKGGVTTMTHVATHSSHSLISVSASSCKPQPGTVHSLGPVLYNVLLSQQDYFQRI